MKKHFYWIDFVWEQIVCFEKYIGLFPWSHYKECQIKNSMIICVEIGICMCTSSLKKQAW